MARLGSGLSQLVYALHGFLGESSDWDSLLLHAVNRDIIIPNFLSHDSTRPLEVSLFYDQIIDLNQSKKYLKKIFIGYSLGGRIGLHLLDKDSTLFDHYIFISTHPGLKTNFEKDERKKKDQDWIEFLRNNTWDEFIKKWNDQDVLKTNNQPQRLVQNFNQNRLVEALSVFSLAEQPNYSELIRHHQERITWVVGEYDKKFFGLAEDLKQKKILLDYKRISCGHRVLADGSVDLNLLFTELDCFSSK